MHTIIACLITFIGTFLLFGALYEKTCESKSEIAIKLSNVMNSTMLDLVTHNVINKEQVHEIESYFHKHIEENFKGIKANHEDEK